MQQLRKDSVQQTRNQQLLLPAMAFDHLQFVAQRSYQRLNLEHLPSTLWYMGDGDREELDQLHHIQQLDLGT